VEVNLNDNSLISGGGLKSSSASVSDAVCNVHSNEHGGGMSYPSHVDHLTKPTVCTLVLITGGFQTEVARGKIFPQQTLLHSKPILDGYVSVLVEFVYAEHWGYVLDPPPNDETHTLGQALFQRVMWRKGWIVVSSKVVSKQVSSSLLKDLVVSDVPSSQLEEAKDPGTIQMCSSKEHAESKK
jgi:hypothetical protein